MKGKDNFAKVLFKNSYTIIQYASFHQILTSHVMSFFLACFPNTDHYEPHQPSLKQPAPACELCYNAIDIPSEVVSSLSCKVKHRFHASCLQQRMDSVATFQKSLCPRCGEHATTYQNYQGIIFNYVPREQILTQTPLRKMEKTWPKPERKIFDQEDMTAFCTSRLPKWETVEYRPRQLFAKDSRNEVRPGRFAPGPRTRSWPQQSDTPVTGMETESSHIMKKLHPKLKQTSW
jgi:hypothetical protein